MVSRNGVQEPGSKASNEKRKQGKRVRGEQVQISIRIPITLRERLNAIAGEHGFDSIAGLLVNQCNKLAS